MAEYKRPGSEVEFQQNFAQKKPLMNASEAFYESSRCLFCYDAPCIKACPTGIDIPLFIKQINTGNTTGAAQTIYDSNWLGNACGKVCPTEVLCEGACVHTHQDVPVIQIGRLQNYATQNAISEDKKLFKTNSADKGRVAIIGSGPAGLACAAELSVLGYSVDIFEASSKPSGLTVYGIAPYKITNKEVLDEVAYLQSQLGFNIHYEHGITSKEHLDELEEQYDAIFLGIGMGPTSELGIQGEKLKGVTGAVEFIRELRMRHSNIHVPDRVIIIGGGNTAMDAGSEAARMGAKEVTLAYRRDKSGMKAYDFEYKLMISSGVDSLFNVQPIVILGEDKVEGVQFIRTEIKEGKLCNIEGSEFDMECDMVIKANGQTKYSAFLELIDGLQLGRSNTISVDENNYQTDNPKYFAGGDAVNGGAEVVNAAFEGKSAAIGIHNYLSNKQ
ncbi:MAG: NAD(P)-dependent oxidoreductase [Saprospiraceae bacterium]|nr:NAD(P)-dependent oxidoreductase [Saprospiraceae bacterium]